MQASEPTGAALGDATTLAGVIAPITPAGRAPVPLSPTAKAMPAPPNNAGNILPKCFITILAFRPCFVLRTDYALFLRFSLFQQPVGPGRGGSARARPARYRAARRRRCVTNSVDQGTDARAATRQRGRRADVAAQKC